MKELEKIYLFIHPIWHLDHPPGFNNKRVGYEAEWFEKWKHLIIEEAKCDENGICILTTNSGPKMKKLQDLGLKRFGLRCVLPDSNLLSDPAVKLLLAEDMLKTIETRGNRHWTSYEMWSSVNARLWAEDFKRKLYKQGYWFDEQTVEFESCGCVWDGCVAKYSVFMGRYIGLSHPIKQNAELSLFHSNKKQKMLMRAKFAERIPMDHDVSLYLFKGENGCPIAHYLDGIRGVWEPPHIASIDIDTRKIDIKSFPIRVVDNKVVAYVGYGCGKDFTPLLGKDIVFEEFRTALINAIISDYS